MQRSSLGKEDITSVLGKSQVFFVINKISLFIVWVPLFKDAKGPHVSLVNNVMEVFIQDFF